MPIQLLIADDHQVVIDGIVNMLEDAEDIYVLGQVQDGPSVLDFVHDKSPEVILLDLDLPGMDGLAVTKALQKSHPDIAIAILTMHGDSAHVKALMNQGAKAYLLKNTGKEELVQAIRTVAQGETFMSQAVTQLMMAHMLQQEKKQARAFIPRLTRREKEVLKLIAEGMTNPEIATHLHISVKTVESHRTNLLDKLDARNSAALVRIAMEKGLV
ncbi:MAG: response regulator transcription factor [Bacteroidota bacterium]